MADAQRPPVRVMLREGIDALGGVASNVELKQWVLDHYPGTNPLTIQAQTIICTVNHNSRAQYPENQKPRAATDERYDFLFRTARGRLECFDPQRHGAWKIVETESGRLAVVEAVEEHDGDAELAKAAIDRVVDSNTFAAEDHLRDYLAKNLETIEPGLQLYADENGTGIEYITPIGRIDILAVDAAGGFVVIELKVGRGSDAVCGQVLRYKGWVKQHLADGRRARGLIIAQRIDDRIRYALHGVEDIDVKEYELHVTLRDVEGF